MEKAGLSDIEIKQLYFDKKLGTAAISKLLGCASSTVFYRLRKMGLILRKRKFVPIAKEELMILYIDQKLSMEKIAKLKSCSASIIFDKLKKYGISCRKSNDATYWKYQRLPFSGNQLEKAYLVGFRLGDLYARNTGQGVYFKTNTTRIEQVTLLKNLFSRYGHLSIRKYHDQYQIEMRLDQTFSFLAPKADTVPSWILDNQLCFISFVAGYTDAEGSIGVYCNRARYRLGSYDKGILRHIHLELIKLGIRNILRLETRAGLYGTWKLNGDFWRLSVNDKYSLLKLLRLIQPYLLHPKRCKDLKEAILNIDERNGTKCEKDILYNDSYRLP